MFSYEGEIRRGIDTINAIESVNSVICKATTRHRMFPDDEVCHEGGPAGDHGCVQKMDHADPEPEIRSEPFLYRIRRSDFSLSLINVHRMHYRLVTRHGI